MAVVFTKRRYAKVAVGVKHERRYAKDRFVVEFDIEQFCAQVNSEEGEIDAFRVDPVCQVLYLVLKQEKPLKMYECRCMNALCRLS